MSYPRPSILAKLPNVSISQTPPLSSKVKELETLLQTPLFERNSRNVTLTEAGLVLQKECEQVFKTIDLSMNKVRLVGRKQQNRISVGLVSSAFWSGFGSALQSFNQQNPDYEIDIVEMAPQYQKQAVFNKEIDFGLVRFADALNIHPLESQKLTDESLVIAVSDTHRLKDRKRINLKELQHEHFSMINTQTSASGDFFAYYCMNEGFKPNIIKELIEPTTLMAYISGNQTITVVPSSFSLHKWKHIRFIRLKESIQAGLYSVYDPAYLTPVASKFLQHLRGMS